MRPTLAGDRRPVKFSSVEEKANAEQICSSAEHFDEHRRLDERCGIVPESRRRRATASAFRQ
jgi:hypothetical protein